MRDFSPRSRHLDPVCREHLLARRDEPEQAREQRNPDNADQPLELADALLRLSQRPPREDEARRRPSLTDNDRGNPHAALQLPQ